MIKTLLSAACAAALFGGAALAQTQPASPPHRDPAPSVQSDRAMPAIPGLTGRQSSDRGMSGTAAGSSAIAPECSGLASEQEVTRCLNRHMAERAERGEDATGTMRQ